MANMDNPKPIGVYKNKRLMHACTSLVGSTVHLQTQDGSVWEGILHTWNPAFTICLLVAIPVDPKDGKDCLYAALKSGLKAKEQAFFDLKDIVRISIVDVDLNYATRDSSKGLGTDADVSGYDPSKSGEQRQLECWQDEDGDNVDADSMQSLDDVALGGSKNGSQNNTGGWDAQDMFRYNEQVHKVTTTYDEKLTDYTLPLPKHSSKEWRKKKELAAAIAKEIDSNTKSQGRLAKEDEGDCEEEKFSAVLRPAQNRPTSFIKTHNSDTTDGQEDNKQPSSAGNPPIEPQHHGEDDNKYNSIHRPSPVRINSGNQNGTHRSAHLRPKFDRSSRNDSLKNFGKQLTLGPSPRQPRNQNINQVHTQMLSSPNNQNQPPLAHQQMQPQQNQLQQQPQHPQPPAQQQPQQQKQQISSTQAHQAPAQVQVTVTNSSPVTASTTSTVNTSTISERSDTSSVANQAKDHQSELARKSTLNPNAKEFVYKPRSPAANQGAQTNGANQVSTSVAATIDPANSSPMSQAPHAPYYQPVQMFPLGLSPHQQQHHAAQFMPNHTHPHFQSQIHYMSPVPPHIAQQMSQRYIRGSFQNYHHRGEHHNNVRAEYSQASMMAPTSSGQPFVPPPSGAPHPMNAYAASQQPMIYNGPPQSMYPVVQAGFPQHVPHVMPNPPPYDGSAVYMPSQNYIVNP